VSSGRTTRTGRGAPPNRIRCPSKPSHTAETAAAHDDQTRPYLLGDPYDLLGPVSFGHPQVLPCYRAPGLLYLLNLGLESLLRLLAELIDHLRDVLTS
jgi:hypothetical protein